MISLHGLHFLTKLSQNRILKLSARDHFCILPRMKKIYGIVPYQKFSCHVTLVSSCGSHPDCSMGQWVRWVNRYDPLSTLPHAAIYSSLTSCCYCNINTTFCLISTGFLKMKSLDTTCFKTA